MTTPYDIAAVRGLQKYLKQEVSAFNNNVFDSWPNHGDKMVLPTCNITNVGTPEYTNLMPYILRKEVDPENALNDLVYTVVAQIDGRIQVDIWAEYKIARSKILELTTKAINKQAISGEAPNGLSLTLSDYYNVIARFDQVGYTNMDSEVNSQTSEWRVKLDLLFSHEVIEVKSIPRISEITLDNQIASDKNVNDDNTDIEESYDVN